MERQDLLPSVTIDEDLPGKASHCNTFFISLSRVEFRTSTQLQWAKTLKGKAKPVPKRSKAENVPLKNKRRLVTHRRTAQVLKCLGPLVSHFSFFSSLPPDSDEESCPRTALPLTLIFKVLAPRIFAGSGSSGDAEIVQGVWPNQEPLSLSARFFFFLWKNGDISFFFGPVFFLFFTQGLLSAFDFSIRVIRASTWEFCHVRDVNKNMQIT